MQGNAEVASPARRPRPLRRSSASSSPLRVVLTPPRRPHPSAADIYSFESWSERNVVDSAVRERGGGGGGGVGVGGLLEDGSTVWLVCGCVC